MAGFGHGERVELTESHDTVEPGTTGTVTHLNGDGTPGTSSYWTNLDGDTGVWVEYDHAAGETGRAFWTPTNHLQPAP